MRQLDAAKRARVLASDPCLFRPEAALKSSREMALAFCRDFMSGGVGDLNKHLATLGLKLCYEQKHLDEYNFRVTNIASELKDGGWTATRRGRGTPRQASLSDRTKQKLPAKLP